MPGRLAIFGPLPPPMTGMEAFTSTLLAELRRADGAAGEWIHVDTSISRSIAEREKLRAGKVVTLVRQAVRSIVLAARGFRAYYPISQNRIGLVRDLALLLPFRLARRPIVIHLHGGMLDRVLASEPGLVTRVLRWVVGGRESRGIVLTPSLRHCLEPLLPRERIGVVPNTSAVPVWTTQKQQDGPLGVLFVGTLVETKGYRELITAVAAIARDGVPIELEVAGEPYAPADSDWLEHSPREGIRLLGRIDGDGKWRAFRRAHVVALPTRYPPEGQPLSIIEGMGAACAIVATRRDGIVDTVGETEALLLEPTAGATLEADLARALRELAGARGRVAAMGRSARLRYERDLAPELFLERWLAAVGR